MGFFSFAGRVLFASVFILSAWQEFNDFGVDGGPAAKTLGPKFEVFTGHLTSNSGIQIPDFEIKQLVAFAIALKGLGGLTFIFGSSLGAYLLILHQIIFTPLVCDFYNYGYDTKEFTQLFVKFAQGLALFGALLFFLGMKNSIPKRQIKKKANKAKTT
ncbi:hypothetical protein ACHQM5_014350 [Ranunculus cassubicifolius]